MKSDYLFFKIPKDIFEMHYAKKIGVYGLAIYTCLSYHKNNKTGACFPSEKTIAKELGIARGSVRKYMEPLLEYGIIERIKKKSLNGRYNHHYKLNPPDKWKKLKNNLCAPHEHIDYSDVHPVTDQCSPDAISDVHDVDTNNKKLTKRNNNQKMDMKTVKNKDQLVDAWNADMDQLTGVNPILKEKLLNTYVLKPMGEKSS